VPLHTIRADIDYAAARAMWPGAGIIALRSGYTRGGLVMLAPKVTKSQGPQGRIRGVATSATTCAYGESLCRLRATTASRRGRSKLRARQMTRYIKRGGKICDPHLPSTPVTRKPLDVKMGSGKGSPEFFAAKVRPRYHPV